MSRPFESFNKPYWRIPEYRQGDISAQEVDQAMERGRLARGENVLGDAVGKRRVSKASGPRIDQSRFRQPNMFSPGGGMGNRDTNRQLYQNMIAMGYSPSDIAAWSRENQKERQRGGLYSAGNLGEFMASRAAEREAAGAGAAGFDEETLLRNKLRGPGFMNPATGRYETFEQRRAKKLRLNALRSLAAGR